MALLISPAARSQEPTHRSIHQIDAHAHRGVQPEPIATPIRSRPLALSGPRNTTRTVFGFYPYWAPAYSQIRFQDLTHLAYFSVEANAAGQLTNLRGWPNGPLVAAAHAANVQVVLVCTLFDPSGLTALLSSPAARETLINALRDQVLAGGADGVNIDFEGVPGSQRSNLVAFMQELAQAVRAVVPGAHISIDTPAVDWSAAFDYAALADICDALMIMCYDYYWSGSRIAGPVSPLASSSLWGKYSVEWTLADYLTKVGPERSRRLVVGVPYYGYDWPVDSDQPKANATPPAASRIYSVAAASALTYGRRWDAFSSTPWYFYVSATGRQCWYDDDESLNLKYDLVFQNSLQGIGIWALTYDRDRSELWELLERRFGWPKPPDPPGLSAPPAWFRTDSLPVAVEPRGAVAATAYQVAVGTSAGGTEVRGFESTGLRRQVLLTGLPLSSGRTYYVTARSVGAEGVLSDPGNSVAIRIDTTLAPARKYVPAWVSSADLYTGLALLNAAADTRAVLLRARWYGQVGTVEASWVLRPGEQMANILSEQEMLGPAVFGQEGWLEASWLGGDLESMYLIGDAQVSRTLSGSPLVEPGVQWIVPELDEGRTVLALANPGAPAGRSQIELYRPGLPTESRALDLAGGQMARTRISDLFPGIQIPAPSSSPYSDPVRTSYLTVRSDVDLACSSSLQRSGDAAAVPCVDPRRVLKEGFFSYVAVGAGYRSDAVFVNSADELQTLFLRLLGSPADRSVSLDLPPRTAVRVDVESLFRVTPDPAVATGGSVAMTVIKGSGVVGEVWLHSEDYHLMATLPLEPAGSYLYRFPQLAQTQGYWTGVCVTNPGTEPADVAVEALDSAGASLGTYQFKLSPAGVRVGLAFQWIPATLGIGAGRLEIRSSAPVLAAEIFGSDTLSFMASIPGR